MSQYSIGSLALTGRRGIVQGYIAKAVFGWPGMIAS
jgi:hypothetical protein